MNLYFDIRIEFDKEIVNTIISNAIVTNQKGYVCAIESNNLTIASKKKVFKETVNHSLINICDGSNVAWLLGILHKQNFHSYTGNDIFMHFISQKKYKHYFIGNTQPVLDSLKHNLEKIDPRIKEMEFVELPFKNVEDFEYKEIAKKINQSSPDCIWVSLGAPKQELFMSMLCPYLHRGIMFGVGAAFNFNSTIGNVKRAPLWMRKLRLEWLHRAIEEPQKNIPRYCGFLSILPQLISFEYQQIKRASMH